MNLEFMLISISILLIMTARFVTGFLLSGLAFALPGVEEALQPCGVAFYYPSKARVVAIFC
jgi:hypothetical protein